MLTYCPHGVTMPALTCPDCINDRQLAGGIESPEGTMPLRDEVPAVRIASIVLPASKTKSGEPIPEAHVAVVPSVREMMRLGPRKAERIAVVQCPHCSGSLVLSKGTR